MIIRAFNLAVHHRTEPLWGSKRMRAFNYEQRPNLRFQSWPWHLLATASSSALRQRLTHVSLRWSEEKFWGDRAFYKHLAPNGAKSKASVVIQSEFANDK